MVENIIKDKTLTFEQKVVALARHAENSIQVLAIDERTEELRASGIICDLFEGNAPYRPRYILPNYEKLMTEGCKFLQLEPPTNIWEATHTLLIFYKHVPSITTMPVYIGNIDTLLDPFIKDEEEARLAIK
ncbi:MAG: glycyl radical enzyme domain-containing protein, partial [Cellulosilyticaceae bacterium]